MSSAPDAPRRFLTRFLKTELPPDAAALLPQLSTAMNLPIGAPAALVAQVMEQHFGPERLATFAEYLRQQRNGVFSVAPRRKGPNLTGE